MSRLTKREKKNAEVSKNLTTTKKRKNEKHTADAELHIKNHPDQKSLSPVRVYPLISDTYGRPARSVLVSGPLICVHLVAETETGCMGPSLLRLPHGFKNTS